MIASYGPPRCVRGTAGTDGPGGIFWVMGLHPQAAGRKTEQTIRPASSNAFNRGWGDAFGRRLLSDRA
jgi:hypothetical protein